MWTLILCILTEVVIVTQKVLRDLSGIIRIFESSHILSLHLIVTSRLGIHSSDTERITLVKLELKTINSKTYWKTINTLLKGESTMNYIPPIQDPRKGRCLK
jgi:hypothetical protein